MFLTKFFLFARTLGSTRLCKISQEFDLLSNFISLPKIKNAGFGHCGPLGARICVERCFKKTQFFLYDVHKVTLAN